LFVQKPSRFLCRQIFDAPPWDTLHEPGGSKDVLSTDIEKAEVLQFFKM
jgi:hypothetical protein